MTEPVSPAIAGVSLITLGIALFGPQAGPYVVIILGSIGGGLWAVGSATIADETWIDRIVSGGLLMLRCVVTAIVLTAVIAGFVGPWLGLPVSEVYAIVAFVIGALGNRWRDIIEAVKKRIEGRISSTGDKP